jgi:hypothetical protein
MFEDCALHQRHSRGVFSKLGAGSMVSMARYIFQSVMNFDWPVFEGYGLRYPVAKWLKAAKPPQS